MIEFVAHVGERLLIAFERGERALLRERAGIRSAVALDIESTALATASGAAR